MSEARPGRTGPLTGDEHAAIIERLTLDYDQTSKWMYRQDILRLLAVIDPPPPESCA